MMRTLVFLLWAMWACVMAIANTRGNDSGREGERNLRKYTTLYLESVCQREAGDTVAQYRLLERAIRLNPNGAEALYDMALLAMERDVAVDAGNYLKRAHELDPTNEDYTFELAQYYMALSDSAGVNLMKSLFKSSDKRDDAYTHLCVYYENLGDYDGLCNILQQWRNVKGDDTFILSCKLQSAMKLGRLNEALLVVDTLLNENPYEAQQYEVLKGEILLGLNRNEEALQVYQQAVDKDPNDAGAQILLYKYATKTGDKQQEQRALKNMILNPDIQMGLRVFALHSFLGAKTTPDYIIRRDEVIKMLVSMPDNDPSLCENMIRLLQSDGGDSLCIPLYNKLLEIDPANEYARICLMQNSLRLNDYEEVERLCTDGLKENARQPLFYYFGGAAQMIAKHMEEAMELFRKGLSYVTPDTNTELVSSCYSSYADALHKLGRKQEAYAMYDSALVYNNGNEMCLNNYAYFLSLDNTNLDKAERMSAYTVKTSPEEPTYLDTYAWILFLKGDYDKARKYIDDAIKFADDKDDPDNAILYDHAGDIYFHLGLTDAAMDNWRQALKLNPDSELIKKKVLNKKYFNDETK